MTEIQRVTERCGLSEEDRVPVQWLLGPLMERFWFWTHEASRAKVALEPGWVVSTGPRGPFQGVQQVERTSPGVPHCL